jgi:hypothetical protein
MTKFECERQIAIFTAKKKALEILDELKRNEYFLSNAGFETFGLQEFITTLDMEIDEKVV